MTDGEILLREIFDNPGDDLPRLKYADWLDENARINPCPTCHGGLSIPLADLPAFRAGRRIVPCPNCHGSGEVSDGQRERAEFIRVQCELESQFPDHGHIPPMRNCRGCELRDRVDHLLSGHGFKFIDSLPGMHYYWSRNPNHYGWFHGNGESQVKIGAIFRRGFVSEIRCTLSQFVGGECLRCRGQGLVGRWTGNAEAYDKCPACPSESEYRGTGRTEGIAAAVFREHPVVSVVFTCREPERFDFGDGGVIFHWSKGPGRRPNELPEPLYDPRDFRTRDDAIQAVGERAVAHGKSLAFPVAEQVAVDK